MAQYQEGDCSSIMVEAFINDRTELYRPKNEYEGSGPEFLTDAPPPFMNAESITRFWQKCTNEYTKETLKELEKSGSLGVLIGTKEGNVFIFFKTKNEP